MQKFEAAKYHWSESRVKVFLVVRPRPSHPFVPHPSSERSPPCHLSSSPLQPSFLILHPSTPSLAPPLYPSLPHPLIPHPSPHSPCCSSSTLLPIILHPTPSFFFLHPLSHHPSLLHPLIPHASPLTCSTPALILHPFTSLYILHPSTPLCAIPHSSSITLPPHPLPPPHSSSSPPPSLAPPLS